MSAVLHIGRPSLLSHVPTPLPGEHIAGYLRRLATVNRMPSLRALTKLLDVVDLTPRSAEPLWDRLAEGLGVGDNFIEPLRWRQAGTQRSWITFLGHEVHESYLDLRKTRFCATCVEETDTLASIWSLRHLTACHIHETRLRETCPGCQKGLRSHTHYCWTCTDCGTDFRDGSEDPAEDYEVTVAASLAAAAIGAPPSAGIAERFPAAWHSASLHERLTTIEYLARLRQLSQADTIPRTLKRQYAPIVVDAHVTSDQHRETAKIATETLACWPEAYEQILESLIDRNPDPSASAPLLRRFSTAAGAFAIRSLQDRAGAELKLIGEARRRFLARRMNYRPGGRDLLRRYKGPQPAIGVNTDVVSTERACELLGATPAVLKVLEKAGMLRSTRPGGRIRAWSIGEIETVRTRIASLPAPPKDNRDLVPAAVLFKSQTFSRQYPSHMALQDMISGTLPAFSRGPTLAETCFDRSDLDYLASVHKIRSWIQANAYRELQFFNLHSTRLWGPMGHYKLREAMQLVAAQELDCIDAKYLVNDWWRARQFRVIDLVRHIQAIIGPRHFDLDDPANPLRLDASALG